MRILIPILSIIALSGCSTTSDLKVVEDFDLKRYMGTWYEVARFNHRFEQGLSSVSATYSLNGNETVKVVNRGYNIDKQSWETIEGIAKPKENNGLGWLKVSFFRPFWASYKVLYIDDEYTKVLIGGPTYDYLWILVRDPALPEDQWTDLIDKARALGYDTDRLIHVNQAKNIE